RRQPAEAVGYFRAAVALRPGSAEAHSTLGYAYLWTGDVDQAIACYQRAIALDPNFGTAQDNLAKAMRVKWHLNDPAAAYRKLLALDPKMAGAHSRLAWLLATSADPKRRDPRQAVAEAQRAVDLDPKNGKYWNTLGVAHYRDGNWRAAVDALE